MKTHIKKLVIIFFLLLPNMALAQAPKPPGSNTPVTDPPPEGQPPGSNTPVDEEFMITNPLEGADIENVGQLITFVINLLLAFVGIIAIISIVIAGYKMIIGSGNSDEVEDAKKRIVWSLAGLAVVLLAAALVRLTVNIFQ